MNANSRFMSFHFNGNYVTFSMKGVDFMNQEKIGKFIAEKRKESNLTQIQFAEKLGVTNKSVSRWETGKNMPDISLFIPICEILGISVNELIIGEEIKNNETAKEQDIIIETIKTSNKKLKLARILIYIVAILLSLIFCIAVPVTASPSDAMAVPLMAFLGTIISTIIISTLNIKTPLKFAFIPVSAIILIIGSLFYTGDAFDYGLSYASIAAFVQFAVILVSLGIRKIIQTIKSHKL